MGNTLGTYWWRHITIVPWNFDSECVWISIFPQTAQKRLGRSGRPEKPKRPGKVGKAGKSGKAKRVCLCVALSACVRSCLFVLFCFCNGSPQFQSYPDTPHTAACTLDCASNNISLERQYSAHDEQQFPMW